jgi:hypothetical protein
MSFLSEKNRLGVFGSKQLITTLIRDGQSASEDLDCISQRLLAILGFLSF